MKSKGSRAERELFHMLWDNKFHCVRSAGSGCTTLPNPDLIASNGSRTLAIECKSIKNERKYFDFEEVEQLRIFSEGFGAEPWIGIRFDNKGWYFLRLDEMDKTQKGFVISFDLAKKQGKSFEELIGLFKQDKLVI